MGNYFNYFTEIEEHFLRRRGGGLLLSTLDWALIETWKDADLPLEAVLRGIDATFDKYEKRPARSRKINSLGFCAQEVLAAAEDVKEAAVGASMPQKERPPGFQTSEIASYLRGNAERLETAAGSGTVSVQNLARESAATLRVLAHELEAQPSLPPLENLERRLSVLEEKLFAAVMTTVSDDEIVHLHAQADRELAPYRRKMPAAQIDQLLKQFIHKKLLEKCSLPRLSLFYM